MSRTILAARKAGLVAPTITAAPVLAWTIGVGTSPAITAPTYTGSPGTITYTLLRDGVPVSGVEDVSEATLEAYVTDTSPDGACDIGPSMTVEATVTNGAGSDSDVSNAVVYDDATRLPDTAIWISTDGVTTADAGATADQWASSFGGIAVTMSATAATNRPAYNATGGVGSRPLITTDGSDNALGGTMTKGSDFSSWRGGFVGNRVSALAAGRLVVGYVVGTTFVMGLSESSPTTLVRSGAAAAGNANSTSNPTGSNAHWSGYHPGGTDTNRMMKGGTVEGTGASGALTTRADAGTVAIGGNKPAGTIYANCAYQAAYWGPDLTADQCTEIRALLSYHTGIAC